MRYLRGCPVEVEPFHLVLSVMDPEQALSPQKNGINPMDSLFLYTFKLPAAFFPAKNISRISSD